MLYERDDGRAARATEPAAQASLVLGPLLRYVGTTTATVWVETDAAATAEVLGHRASTFCVEGHHYALVQLEDLQPGTVHPYQLRLDGHRVWPPADGRPDPVIRTREGERQTRLIFGSCRVVARNVFPTRMYRQIILRGSASMRSGPTPASFKKPASTGRTGCCSSAIRSTQTTSRPRWRPSSVRAGTSVSLRGAR